MATPYSTTTLEFTELDVLDTQVADIVAALQAAQTAVEATTSATITTTCDPDDTTTATCAAAIMGEIQSTWIRNPVRTALMNLIDALNAIVEGYGAQAVP